MFNTRAFSKITASLAIIFLLGGALFYSSSYAQEEEVLLDSEGWSSIESNFFIVDYDSSANLEDIEKALTKRPLYFDQAARCGEPTAAGEICYRLDKLYNRVQDTLDMYPKMPKIRIKIFKYEDELGGEYVKIFGKEEDLKSFYIYKYNTIYISENDIEDSVIIHEMAHAIIDHYFSVIPPEAVSEILASYVDAHLEG